MAQLPRSLTQRTATSHRLTTGSDGGRSRLVAPEPRPPVIAPQLPPTVPYLAFGQADDAVTVADGGVYKLQVGGPLGVWWATLREAGTTTTSADVELNGLVVGSVSLLSGEDEKELDLSDVLGQIGDRVSVVITLAGTDARKFTMLAPIR